jgi:hypothetical protein
MHNHRAYEINRTAIRDTLEMEMWECPDDPCIAWAHELLRGAVRSRGGRRGYDGGGENQRGGGENDAGDENRIILVTTAQ